MTEALLATKRPMPEPQRRRDPRDGEGRGVGGRVAEHGRDQVPRSLAQPGKRDAGRKGGRERACHGDPPADAGVTRAAVQPCGVHVPQAEQECAARGRGPDLEPAPEETMEHAAEDHLLSAANGGLSVSRATSESGLPDTVGESGRSTPSAVPSSTAPNVRFAHDRKPSLTTSLNNTQQAVFSAMACYRTTSPTQQRDLAAAAAALADHTGFPLLVDLRPGVVIIDSGKDQWEDDAHGLETRLHRPRRKSPDRCPRTRGHGGSGAAALRSALPRRRRRRRSPRVLGRRTRIHPRPASRGHRHPRSAAAEPGAGVPTARCCGDGAAPAAQPHPLRARGAVGPRPDAPRHDRRSRWPAP